MRVLGLDYGEKTIGVAISDISLTFAFGLEVIRRPADAQIKKSIARLGEIIAQYDIGALVLGYPKNLDGTKSLRCLKTDEFRDRLRRNFKRAEIILWDERYSTKAVGKVLTEGKVKQAERGWVIDKMAAVYILQGYLDSLPKEDANEQ